MALNIIYAGRLDQEKGILSLIKALPSLLEKHKELYFHIYGSGQYHDEIEELSLHYPEHIFFYGWQKKSDFLTKWKQMDYMIMPSEFLETFGLTACESLLCGVPVIGNRKGGLVPFIEPRLDLQEYSGDDDSQKIISCLNYIIENNLGKENFEDLIQSTKTNYTKQAWLDTMSPVLGGHNKLLLSSDYINEDGGGVEGHLHDVRKILHSHNYSITLYGHHASRGRFQKLKKLLLMIASICNIKDSIRLRHIHNNKNIELIRRHSISRVLGRLPLYTTRGSHNIITHHELGLFHPYPSKVTTTKQLPQAWSLSSFLKAGKAKNPLSRLLLVGKYFLIWLIHKQLQTRVATHIVPSEWMIDMVKARHPDASIVCVPHFVSLENSL